ncbi:amidohydrolase [Streptomyces sp. NBC_01477]|uniref:amidohydrolase n=1 Tax=Streptomyces sp. NBC_01477 TaxID=2976015 RepID=UPI002E2F8F4F|nr:amidohydrolase [Streptomyces sp. NBC_01477]
MAGARGRLVDAYGHGVLPGDLGIGAFEALLPGAAAPGTTLFDSPAGFAVRRWCPPLLGLEPHCSPARYLARRRELGAYEAARLLLRGTGIRAYLVDTGEPGDLTPPKELGAAGSAAAYEIVRLEPLAQQVADTSGTVDCFLANLAESVHGAALSAVGFSCAAEALVDGPPPSHGPPGPVEVRYAAARWLATRRIGERPADPVLLRHLVWHALAGGLPLALRHRQDGPGPAAVAGFLRATSGLGTDVVLLPGPAHVRSAALLAADLPHVCLAIGGDPAEALSRAPFGKVLYAGGAVGLPELYVSGARGFLAALDRLVGERVAAGEWSAADGQRVAALVGEGNARRVYRLPGVVGRRGH